MDPTDKEGPDFGTDEQGAPHLTGHRFRIAVRVADMPDDLGRLLGPGLEEYVRGR